jgi:hypothetical protein
MLRLLINVSAFALMIFILVLVGVTASGFAQWLTSLGGVWAVAFATSVLYFGLWLAAR